MTQVEIETVWVVILGISLLAGILSGLPVIFVIAGVPTVIGFIAHAFGHFDLSYFQAVPQRIFGVMENRLLIAVPLFVMMGVLLERSRQAERMLDNINRLFGGSRTALALSVLFVSTLIAASTGIIGATIVALGTISLPSLLRSGVDDRTASGLICASGTLGQIIPPSIVLILLGDQVSNAYIEAQQIVGNFAPDSVTIGDLFAGALLPGLLLVGLYAAYAVFRLRGSAPVEGVERPVDRAEMMEALRGILPSLLLIFAVLGSILFGIATPTEAAGVGVAGTILIAAAQVSPAMGRTAAATGVLAIALVAASIAGLLKVDFSTGHLALTARTMTTVSLLAILGAALLWHAGALVRTRVLVPAVTETLLVSGMIFGIIIAASILSLVFRGFRGDELVADLLNSVPGGPYGMLAATMLVIFLLGFILEFVEIIFIVVPIVGPVILQADISPVWFAILIALNLQTSFLTPPFGFALFYFRSVAPPHIRTVTIYRAIIPFVIIQLIAILCLALVPALATWLPDLLF
ncbi:tripartite transporter [Zhengella mangrovi]|uniref:Tripartite transporter n=1 Tax=Zhengella mangrovi TaxID=1982044 RepID=A0A2G1QRK5_9HYPH|nr:TRAP transporter large permease subunit [Zhengella mangrovi]PHP68153.1 tripartite transporter [Zhengella mangrovi]